MLRKHTVGYDYRDAFVFFSCYVRTLPTATYKKTVHVLVTCCPVATVLRRKRLFHDSLTDCGEAAVS